LAADGRNRSIVSRQMVDVHHDLAPALMTPDRE